MKINSAMMNCMGERFISGYRQNYPLHRLWLPNSIRLSECSASEHFVSKCRTHFVWTMTTADSENAHISLLKSHETRLFSAAFGGIFFFTSDAGVELDAQIFGSVWHRFWGGNESCATLSALSKMAISIIPTAGHGAMVDGGALTTVYQLRLTGVLCNGKGGRQSADSVDVENGKSQRFQAKGNVAFRFPCELSVVAVDVFHLPCGCCAISKIL